MTRERLRTELIYLRGLLGVYLQPNAGGSPQQQADELRYVIAVARERRHRPQERRRPSSRLLTRARTLTRLRPTSAAT